MPLDIEDFPATPFYTVSHPETAQHRQGLDLEALVADIGLPRSELVISSEPYATALLRRLPIELQGVVGAMAWDRGHSAGLAEVEMVLKELVDQLAPAVATYGHRIKTEASARS